MIIEDNEADCSDQQSHTPADIENVLKTKSSINTVGGHRTTTVTIPTPNIAKFIAPRLLQNYTVILK